METLGDKINKVLLPDPYAKDRLFQKELKIKENAVKEITVEILKREESILHGFSQGFQFIQIPRCGIPKGMNEVDLDDIARVISDNLKINVYLNIVDYYDYLGYPLGYEINIYPRKK